tara:strand:+ start:2732 stop:2923 length:192 start_codon:yes stop_codon:yes gene_type:complete
MKMTTATRSQIGCGEMSKAFTFSVTVEPVAGTTSMLTHQIMEYLEKAIESESLLHVTNIVRDY